MRRFLIAVALIVAWVATAGARPRRQVAVETEPPGAKVYLTKKGPTPACITPCTIDALVGKTTVIFELDGYKPASRRLVVAKRGPVPTLSVKLQSTRGTIVIDGPVGASVRVDDIDRGKAPTRVELSAVIHHVVVAFDGKALYDQDVEVSGGSEIKVIAQVVPTRDLGPRKITQSAASKRTRDRFVTAEAAFDIGFRHFTYDGVETPQWVREESERGKVLAGPIIELWPGELVGIRMLRGLSLLARLQLGVNAQRVTGNGIMATPTTFWQSMELSLRHRWTFARRWTFEAGAGYVRDQFQFEGSPADFMLVPDVDYKSIRAGGRASVIANHVEPYLVFERRIVRSAGKHQERFADGTQISGWKGAVGINIRYGSILGRLEGAYTRYTWDLEPDPMGMYRATSGIDAIRQVQLAVGYQY